VDDAIFAYSNEAMDTTDLNPLYEKVIEDLMEQQYSIVDDFFDVQEVQDLRES